MKHSKIWPGKPKKTSNRYRRTDLAPDGVRISVEWTLMEPGMSVFIPAVDLKECVSQLYDAASYFRWRGRHEVRIENGKQGVRFWRVL